MIERDENGMTRAIWRPRQAFNVATTPDALRNEERDLASRGIHKSTEEIFRKHVNALLDELKKEDECPAAAPPS
jgi:hypothetical protein